jgi:MSHA pilin protein MshC
MLSRSGFTLIELVVLLLVVGLLSAFAFQRLGSVGGMKAAAFTDKLRADLRYAQNVAMTRNRRARVYFNGVGTAPAAGYAVVVDGAAGLCNAFTAVADPAGTGNLTVTLAAGDYAGITVTPNASSCLEYDSLGTPYNCFAGPANCSATAAGMTFTVPAASAAVNTITVAAGTGAVN